MSPPTGRVLALLELLQTLPGATATELAGRLSVDERTVRRDAAHLCDLGIPVRARRGRYGGFRLAPQARGHRLTPLILTEREAVAIVLGLMTAAGVGLSTGANGDSASAAALAKISRILPEALVTGAASMLAEWGLAADGAGDSEPPPMAIILVLTTAASHQTRVLLTYEGQPRQVTPRSVSFADGHWTMIGRETGCDSERTFDLCAIDEVEPFSPARSASPLPRQGQGLS